MKIIDFDIYRDGGTIKIVTDEGDYYLDGRINTKTRGKLFLGYPMLDNSNIILGNADIIINLRDSLKNYNSKKLKYLVSSVINHLDSIC